MIDLRTLTTVPNPGQNLMSSALRPWLLILPALLLLASCETPEDTETADGQATATKPVRRRSRPKAPPPRRLKITISKLMGSKSAEDIFGLQQEIAKQTKY